MGHGVCRDRPARAGISLLAFLLLLLSSSRIQAAAGNFDYFFGIGGIAIHDIGVLLGFGPTDDIHALLPYPAGDPEEGKILAVGEIYDSGDDLSFSIQRYHSDGSLDGSFGQGGAALVDLELESSLHDAALQPDGKILAAGTSFVDAQNFHGTVVRFCPDGKLDDGANCGSPGFGNGGMISGPNRTGFEALVLQADGKILVGGAITDGGTLVDLLMMRYCADGKLDDGANCGAEAFGQGGVSQIDVSAGGVDAFNDLAVQPDGKILGYGVYDASDTFDIMLARFCPNGSFDDGSNCGAPGFAKGGVDLIDLGGSNDNPDKVTLLSDGKILAAGHTDSTGQNRDLFLLRFCPDGGLDDGSRCGAAGFGDEGVLIDNFYMAIADSGEQEVVGLAIQADGKIVAGVDVLFEDIHFVAARYLTDGSRDPNFGVHGLAPLHNDSANVHAMALQSDGKVVFGGSVPGDDLYDSMIGRFTGDSGDLSLDLAADPATLEIDETVDFRIKVENLSDLLIGGVRVAVELPANAELVSAPGCEGDGSLVCRPEAIEAGGSAEWTITVKATAAGVAAMSARVDAAITELDPSNNEDTAFAAVNGTDGGDGNGSGDGGGCSLGANSLTGRSSAFLLGAGLLALCFQRRMKCVVSRSVSSR